MSREQIAQPYLWPNFPFFPGVNFPPSFPAWMTERRPTALPQLPELRLPEINLPWPFPPGNGDDDDSEEEEEECPDDGIKFISHPDSCEKYILCIDGDEIATLTCPPDFHFSRDLRGCTTPEDAECE